jgi:hypothetical protein
MSGRLIQFKPHSVVIRFWRWIRTRLVYLYFHSQFSVCDYNPSVWSDNSTFFVEEHELECHMSRTIESCLVSEARCPWTCISRHKFEILNKRARNGHKKRH